MIPLGLFAAMLSSAPVEDRTVLPGTREVTIDCPARQTTRVVLPERVRGYRGDPTAEALLGLHIETRPRAVISLQPKQHPLEARFRVDGITRRLLLVFRTVPDGKPREIRLSLASSPPAHKETGPAHTAAVTAPLAGDRPRTANAPVPSAAPAIADAKASAAATADGQSRRQSPSSIPATVAESSNKRADIKAAVEPEPTVEPAPDPVPPGPGVSPQEVAAPTRAASSLLDPGILTARVRSIGRIESLPGQRPVELVDLLEGSRYLWLRFSIGDGKGARLERIWWEHGPITTFATEEEDHGKRLAVVVQLPRRTDTGAALITKRTRVHIKLSDGERTFALSAPWLGVVVKDLFGW
jgi:hypothetical protein